MDALFLLSGLGMMAVALLAVIYWKRRQNAALALFLYGALAWFTGTILKSLVAIPVPAVMDGTRAVLPRYLSEPILALYIGLLTGILECGIVLLFARIRRVRSVDWKGAVAFGLGFGAVEAFLLGFYSFVTVLLLWLAPDQLPAELVELATSQSGSLLTMPAPIVERAVVVLVHAFSCVLILYAVRTREWKWFWISFAYKTVLDAIAGFVQITYGVQNLTVLGTWAVELALLPFGIAGLWGLRDFRRGWPGENTPPTTGDESMRVQAEHAAATNRFQVTGD